jgi:hypothetical protein
MVPPGAYDRLRSAYRLDRVAQLTHCGQIALLATLLQGCSTAQVHPCSRDAAPESIDEVVATLEVLPSPVTLDCFLVSLERPLGLELTSNPLSMQPADGPESPRIFLRSDELNMSVVPAGEGRHLLEFGEVYSDLSVKAELAFPIVLPLDPETPFARVRTPDGPTPTGCGVCHAGEIDVGEGRFASTPLRPRASTLVSIDDLRHEHETCASDVDPERCSMLSALLDHGDVFHDPFPDDLPVLTEE